MPYSTWRDGSWDEWQQAQSSTWSRLVLGSVSTGYPEPWPGMEGHANQNLRTQQLSSESLVLPFKKMT